MNHHRLIWLAFGLAVLLSACGEKNVAEPIPDSWAKTPQPCPRDMEKKDIAGQAYGCMDNKKL